MFLDRVQWNSVATPCFRHLCFFSLNVIIYRESFISSVHANGMFAVLSLLQENDTLYPHLYTTRNLLARQKMASNPNPILFALRVPIQRPSTDEIGIGTSFSRAVPIN